MKIFIIGIAGKIGSRLAQRLIARGDEVDGLFRRGEQAETSHVGSVHRVGKRIVGQGRQVTLRGLNAHRRCYFRELLVSPVAIEPTTT